MTIKNMETGKKNTGAITKSSSAPAVLSPEWILSTTVIVASSILVLVEVAMSAVVDHAIESILSAIIVFFTVFSSYTFVYRLVRVLATRTILLADVFSLFVAIGMITVCTLEYLRVVVRMTEIGFRGFHIFTLVLAIVVFFLASIESRLRDEPVDEDYSGVAPVPASV